MHAYFSRFLANKAHYHHLYLSVGEALLLLLFLLFGVNVLRTHTHMILYFVHKQTIKSFVNISHFFDKINRHTKMHIIIKKSVLFAKLCVRKPMVNGSKMT